MNRVIFFLILSLLLWEASEAQIRVLPDHSKGNVSASVSFGGTVLAFNKGVPARSFELANEFSVSTASFSMGLSAGVQKKFSKSPFSVSVNYFGARFSAGLFGDNEASLLVNPIERAFLISSGPRERIITFQRQLWIDLKTAILSGSIRKRTDPGIYIHLLSGIGQIRSDGDEVVFWDPPSERVESWREQSAYLSAGTELELFPVRDSQAFSFLFSMEKRYLTNPGRLKKSLVSFHYGFRVYF